MTQGIAPASLESIIPVIESNLFEGNPTSRFAVGMLAVGQVIMPGLQNEYLGYLRLRANVYAHQTEMIPLESVLEDGTERDDDDDRSVHFGIIENCGRAQRVIASMRLIIKNSEDGKDLPIEHYYPVPFIDDEAPINSCEVSRYICRHEDPKVQRKIRWPLIKECLSYVIENALGPTYAVVEPPLERGLGAMGVPVSRLAEPCFLPEYNAENLPILIDTSKLAETIDERIIGSDLEGLDTNGSEFKYFGVYKELDNKAAA